MLKSNIYVIKVKNKQTTDKMVKQIKSVENSNGVHFQKFHLCEHKGTFALDFVNTKHAIPK